jgi:hypothetical protein
MSGRIKFHTDEHVSKAVINGLRQRGVDVMTTKDAGLMGAADEEHLSFAHGQRRVIFTQDEDFLRLHEAGIEHSGIIYAPQTTSIGEIVHSVMLVYQVFTDEDMENHVEFV